MDGKDIFAIVVGDYILAPIITAGLLDALKEINLNVGLLIGICFGVVDTIIYLKNSFNIATKIILPLIEK